MANTYTLIASNTLGSSAASVTFSAIPGTYTDLVLRISARSDRTATAIAVGVEINNNTSATYSWTLLRGDGASATSLRSSGPPANIGVSPAASATSNTFSNQELYIPNYTGTTKKVMSSATVAENNATTGYIEAYAELVDITTAITQITLKSGGGANNFTSGSSFFLYGIKNS